MPRLKTLGIRRVALCLFALAVCHATTAFAQLPQTRLYSVFPPGGQAGTTVELKITGGDDLEEISQVRFSHPGIVAKPKMVEGQPLPVENTFDVTIAADVPSGSYEVYASGYWGWSNPRTFIVDRRKEVAETEPNSENKDANPAELGTIINGRLEAGTDVDIYRIKAAAGARLVADCWASRIDSKMMPVLELYDSAGRKVAHTRSGRAADAVLAFDAPAEGEYLLKVFDQTFRNGQDYFYRLDLHTGPFIAFVLPPVGQAGTTANVSAYGFNLPGGQPTEMLLGRAKLERLDVSIPIPGDPTLLNVESRLAPVEAGTDAFSWRLDSPQGPSNPVRIEIGQSAGTVEQEPNDAVAPQSVSVPLDLGGQFAAKGDVDAFAFDVKAGDVQWIEVFGQRLGGEVDPVLIVEHVTKEADGTEKVNRLTVQDDIATNLAPNAFDTQTDDAAFRFVAPSDGRCRVVLQDRYSDSRGDASLVYRLVVHPESPDFRLVALPAQAGVGQTGATTLRKGEDFTLNVLAYRREGFNGAIDVRVEGLPAGVTSAGTTIGPNQTSAPLVLTSTNDVGDVLASIRLVGTARIYKPALVAAQQSSKAAVENAQKPVPDLRKAAEQEFEKLRQALEQSTAAFKAANEKPDDANLKTQLVEKQKQLEAAQATQKPALEKLLAAEKAVADARVAAEQAKVASETAAAQVERQVRVATVVWSTANNKPAFSRIARELPIGTMKEAVAYQIQVGVPRVDAQQGRQVLVPVKLERRNGFDGEVQVAINGRPNNSNIDGQNFKFEKDKTEFLLPLFVKENSAPDTYALFLTGQAQVSYRRNPEKADRAKAEFDAQAAVAKTTQEESQKATQAKNDATQKATDAANKLTQEQQNRQNAENALKAANQALEQAKTAKEAAEKKATDAAAALKTADDAVAAAKKELEADPNNDGLKQKVAAAEQAAATAKTAAEQAEKEKADATTKFTEAETAAKLADEAFKKSDEALKVADAEKKTADEAKVAAEKAEVEAQNKAKAEEEKRVAAEQKSKQANDAAQAKNLNLTPNSAPIVIAVKPSPMKLSASAANSGQVKRGEKVEIKATITRQNGFAGPVTLTLALPPGLAGLAADNPVVPADKNEGTLTVTAAADAPEGDLKNIVLRAVSDFDGTQAMVDAPVAIKVMP
jgi:hypothetical protein